MVRRCWVNFQCRGVLLIWSTVGQGLTALAVGAGGGCLDVFSLVYHFSFLSPSLWETARYRLKYCLKGPLNPKQPTNQPAAFSRRAVVSYWRKYVHEVLVNRLGGLSLSRKSVVRLTDRPDMTLDVYRGHKNNNATFVSPSAFSRRAVASYWRKYVHEVLVNRLGGLCLPRNSVVRLTDRPDMTLDVYRGRKTIMQQQRHHIYVIMS